MGLASSIQLLLRVLLLNVIRQDLLVAIHDMILQEDSDDQQRPKDHSPGDVQ